MNATATAASATPSNYGQLQHVAAATSSPSAATASQVSQVVAAAAAAAAAVQAQGNVTSAVGSNSAVGLAPSEPMSSSLPVIKPEIFLNDHSLVAVYCFVKNFIGASGTSAVAIDNKIEQAMDLVKSHLMFAVREEVEVLKEKISELMDRINQLEYENNILKQNASQETLSQLTTGGGGGASNTSTTAAAAAVVAAAAAAAAATAAAAASASAPSAPVPASKGPTSAATNPSSNGSVS